MNSHIWGMGGVSKDANLELFVERLMSGTRLKSVLDGSPDLETKNTLTLIQKTDKKLAKQSHGYQIMSEYEFLCELAHPNLVGFARFLLHEKKRDDGWVSRSMYEFAVGPAAEHIIERCLWALSFGCGTMNGSFEEFQKVLKLIGGKLGRPLPY